MKLTDENPYDILDIPPDTNRQEIKKAFALRQKQDRGEDRRNSRAARDLLFKTETRLLVDAMMPDFLSNFDGAELIAEFGSMVDEPDWLSFLDRDEILRQDLQALIEATIRSTFEPLPDPPERPELSMDYDGLDDFIKAWLE